MWVDKDGNIAGNSIVINIAAEGEDPHYMRVINPTDEQYIQAGYHWEDPPEPQPDPEYERRRQEYLAACAQFRAVCAQIQQAAGFEEFKGGFDEMVEFQQSPIYSTLPGVQLAIAWSAANDLCTYTAKKIGLGQPEWWYDCWEQVQPEQDTEEPEAVEDITSDTPQIEEPTE